MTTEPTNAEILAALDALRGDAEPAAKRGRGRPPGSKNRPKEGTYTGRAAVAARLASAAALPSTVEHAQVRAATHAAELVDAAAPTIDLAGTPADVPIDMAVVSRCADACDQSDTGNADRLIAHFGGDLAVLSVEGETSSDYHVWTGTHWDAAHGNDRVKVVAQRIGARIVAEADLMAYSAGERETMRKAAEIRRMLPPTSWTEEDRATVAESDGLPDALAGRRTARRKFGTSTRNAGRMKAMLETAAPRLTRSPEAWNADPMLVATSGHTLRFWRRKDEVEERDLECPDPDVERFVRRTVVTAGCDAVPGHDRRDLITKLLPAAYDPEATCPRFTAFIEEFLPDAEVRRMVQVFSGLGMTGIGLQKVLCHHGSGANGKSALMETLMQVMGPLGVGLPAASLIGDSKSSGNQANPDIARLYGARIVRVAELPPDEPVKEALVKILTGGERMPARNLFKGFFEFTPVFKAHLSCNKLPRIDGTDNGIWRRMVVVPWKVTIPEERQRELREVVAEFVAEGSGILNWLIAGVLIFLQEGFVVPEACLLATKQYRDDMDPVGQFMSDCVHTGPDYATCEVQARTMHNAYVRWSQANAKTPFTENKFGRVMKERLPRDDKRRLHTYLGCKLHDVPDAVVPDTGLPEQR